ncbi:MAG: hypothetical protein QG599_3659 [Pseudomonadota bacterium]|nr:hypothetical protein [Pseudomonadota bacterium]
MLENLQNQLEDQLHEKLLNVEEKIDLKFKEVESNLYNQMHSFREEMKINLLQHSQAIDRQLTDFLNKQNALINNLTQQIDSYSRVSQAQASEILVINSKINIRDENTSKFESALNKIAERLSMVSSKLLNQDEKITKIESLSQAVEISLNGIAKRLDGTLKRLKESIFTRGKFNDI